MVPAPSAPPAGVVARARSSDSIIVQWQTLAEEDWNGPPLGYSIRYKPSGFSDVALRYVNVTDHLENTLELRSLIVFQEYEIGVAAYNQGGSGAYSSYVRVRTQEGRPTAPPTELNAAALNSTAVVLTWLPPDPQRLNGINLGYRMRATILNGDRVGEVVEVVVPSDPTNMLGRQTGYLQDLAKFTEYSMTVLCFTSRGDGPMSSAVVVRTMEDGRCDIFGGRRVVGVTYRGTGGW